jgi:hypothetical protein
LHMTQYRSVGAAHMGSCSMATLSKASRASSDAVML